MNTPSHPIPVVSNPSIKAMESSIRTLPKPSKASQFVLLAIVVIALAALVLSFFLFVDKTEKNKEEVARQEALAWEIKHINAQSFRSLDRDLTKSVQDESFIFFNFYTTPPGANVYQNGNYLGTTPIEQKKLPKSAENEEVHLVIVLDGHRIERRTIQLADNYSDTIELEKMVAIPNAKTVDGMIVTEDGGLEEAGVFANKAIVMPEDDDAPDDIPNNKNNAASPVKKPAPEKPSSAARKPPKPASDDDDIVLPD